MTLKERIKQVRDKYAGEFVALSQFAETTEKSLTRKQKRKSKTKLSKEDLDTLGEVSEFLKGTSVKNQPKSIEVKSKAVVELMMQVMIPIKHRGFLSDMTLSHLIAFQEAMQKDYLHAILMSQKASLKSNSKLTYDEALSHKSMKSLHEALVAKEVDQLGYGSIDDVAKHYQDKFNIKLSEFSKWDFIVEAHYRRNIVVHNKGRINQIYRKQVKGAKVGTKPTTDNEYLKEIVTALVEYTEFFHESISMKFKIS